MTVSDSVSPLPKGGGQSRLGPFLNRPTVYSKVKTQKNLPYRHCCCARVFTLRLRLIQELFRETPESSDGLFHGLINPQVLWLHDYDILIFMYLQEESTMCSRTR